MPNIALVVLDTLRKDTFDKYFNWLPGLRFENGWAPAHYTIPSHASMFTGKYPSEIGVHAKSEVLDCEEITISEKLKKNGFTTRAISANLLASPINDFDRGFDEFHLTGRAETLDDGVFPWMKNAKEMEYQGIFRNLYLTFQCIISNYNFPRSLKMGWKIKKDRFSSIIDTIDIIDSIDFGTNEFLFVNIMDSHAPYSPPDEYFPGEYEVRTISEGVKINDKSEMEDQKQAYEASAKYLSNMYQNLFQMMRRDFDYIITLSDHGELFGEYGTSKHYFGVFPELTQIPISIFNGEDNVEEINKTVGLLDIYETILEMANVSSSKRDKSLLSGTNNRDYITESHGLRQPWRDSLRKSDVDSGLMDKIDQPLRGIAMPNNYYGFQMPNGEFVEQGKSIEANPKLHFDNIVSRLEQELLGDIDSSKEEMSEDVKNQLRSLGYLD